MSLLFPFFPPSPIMSSRMNISQFDGKEEIPITLGILLRSLLVAVFSIRLIVRSMRRSQLSCSVTGKRLGYQQKHQRRKTRRKRRSEDASYPKSLTHSLLTFTYSIILHHYYKYLLLSSLENTSNDFLPRLLESCCPLRISVRRSHSCLLISWELLVQYLIVKAPNTNSTGSKGIAVS